MQTGEGSHHLMMGSAQVDARPEHIGPGYWKALHHWAYVHDTSAIPGAREMFVDNMIRGTGQHFECMECRSHASEYMHNKDPVRNILKLNKTGPDGVKPLMVCLAWTYRFHEAVNERLKKLPSQRPTFSQLESYLSDLREGKGCQDCGPITAPTVESQPVPKIALRKIRRSIVD